MKKQGMRFNKQKGGSYQIDPFHMINASYGAYFLGLIIWLTINSVDQKSLPLNPSLKSFQLERDLEIVDSMRFD